MREIGNCLRHTIPSSKIKIEFVLFQLSTEDNIFIIILFLFKFNLLTNLAVVLFHYTALCFQISRCFMTIDSVSFIEIFSNYILNLAKHIPLVKLSQFVFCEFVFLIVVLLMTVVTINSSLVN